MQAALSAYGSALVEMGNCSLDACPGLGGDLKDHLANLKAGLNVAIGAKALSTTEASVREELGAWGRQSAKHYQGKAREVKELLLVMARTAECRRVMELAIAELARLELAQRTAQQRERAGRSLVAASASSGEIADRIAGMEESRSASRLTVVLASRIRAAQDAVAKLRHDYLHKRTSRLQAETLAETERARVAAISLRRGQQALDDWYLNRRRLDDDR